MSRPKKTRAHVESLPPDNASGGSLERDALRRHADPYKDLSPFMLDSLGEILGSDDTPAKARAEAGAWLISLIRNLDLESCKSMFAAILRAKENLSLGQSRQSYALSACADFIRQTGRPPSKPELKEFILARSNKYRDCPSAGDGKGWTRLWKETHLDGLSSR